MANMEHSWQHQVLWGSRRSSREYLRAFQTVFAVMCGCITRCVSWHWACHTGMLLITSGPSMSSSQNTDDVFHAPWTEFGAPVSNTLQSNFERQQREEKHIYPPVFNNHGTRSSFLSSCSWLFYARKTDIDQNAFILTVVHVEIVSFKMLKYVPASSFNVSKCYTCRGIMHFKYLQIFEFKVHKIHLYQKIKNNVCNAWSFLEFSE